MRMPVERVRFFVFTCALMLLTAGAVAGERLTEYTSVQHGVTFSGPEELYMYACGKTTRLRFTQSGVELYLLSTGDPQAPLGGIPSSLVEEFVLEKEEDLKRGTMRGRQLWFRDKFGDDGMIAFAAVPNGQPVAVLARYSDAKGQRVAQALIRSLRPDTEAETTRQLETHWRDLSWERAHRSDLAKHLSRGQRAIQMMDYRTAARAARAGLDLLADRSVREQATRELIDNLHALEREAVQRGMLRADWDRPAPPDEDDEPGQINLKAVLDACLGHDLTPLAPVGPIRRMVFTRIVDGSVIATFELFGRPSSARAARLVLVVPPDHLPTTMRNLALLLDVVRALDPESEQDPDWIAEVCEMKEDLAVVQSERREAGRVLRLRRYPALNLIELRILPETGDAPSRQAD